MGVFEVWHDVPQYSSVCTEYIARRHLSSFLEADACSQWFTHAVTVAGASTRQQGCIRGWMSQPAAMLQCHEQQQQQQQHIHTHTCASPRDCVHTHTRRLTATVTPQHVTLQLQNTLVIHCKKTSVYPLIFGYFNLTVPHTFVSVNRLNNES